MLFCCWGGFGLKFFLWCLFFFGYFFLKIGKKGVCCCECVWMFFIVEVIMIVFVLFIVEVDNMVIVFVVE